MPRDTNVPKPITVRRAGAASMVGEGVSKIDELIATGQIEAKKSGKNLLIIVASLERYIEGLPPAELKSYGRYKKIADAAAAAADYKKPTTPEAADADAAG
jgi:hypothetical protein